MNKGIEKLEQLVVRLEKDYENALQSEDAMQVAYKEGVIEGVGLAIEEIKAGGKGNDKGRI